MITTNAKELIKTIGSEYNLQMARCHLGYVADKDVMAHTLERLQLKAKSNENLRIFLATVAHVPPGEDEHMHHPWAKDPREPDPVHDVRPERAQRARDEDGGLVPATVHTAPHGL